MPQTRNAKPGFAAMAWNPSYRAPRAKSVLNPLPFVPPTGPRLHPEERRLLDAVLNDPKADAPRLAFAEWQFDQGEARRGAFIGAQLAGDRVEPDAAWAAVFEPWSAADLVYRRGFVEALSLAGRAFITLGAPLFELTPLQEVRLVAVQPYLKELAATPHLSMLHSLNLRGNQIGDDGLQVIAASLTRLVHVDLSGNGLTAKSQAAIQSLRLRGVAVTVDRAGSAQAA